MARRSQFPLRRALLISACAAMALFSSGALAADDATTSNAGTTTTASTRATAQTTTSRAGRTTATTGTTTATGSTQRTSTTTTATSTNTGSAGTTSLPPLSTGTGTKLPLPTLPSTADGSIPTYPPPSVPPTQNAPFMKQSALPDGTVFIAVGAILGAFGATVLVWRAVVIYLLHRSIARATQAQHAANDKTPFPVPPAPFHKYTDHDSTVSLAGGVLGLPGGGGGGGGGVGVGSSNGGGTSARGARRLQRGPMPSSAPSHTNLFFSPTAPGANGLSGGAGNRDSRLLPSGFYAAGSSSPASGSTTVGNVGSISVSNLNARPDSRSGGGGRGLGGFSPPDSPAFSPQRRGHARHNRSSSGSINLNRPPSGRTPSAFLDELLGDQARPFPAAGSGPAPPPHQQQYPPHHQYEHRHQYSYSQSSIGGAR